MYFCIPSYKRTHILAKYTLPFLSKHDIDKKYIFIFAGGIDQYHEYRQAFPGYNVILGRKGIANIHNDITNYFSNNEKLILIDDDIEDLKCIDDKEYNLYWLLSKCFDDIILKGKTYFGFYAGHWQREQERIKPISDGLSYILGCFVGVINNRKCQIPQRVQYKEDVYRVLFNFENGGLSRYNKYYIKTKYYRKDGGLSCDRTNENERTSAEALEVLFPCYIKTYQKKDKTQFKFNRYLL